MVEKRLVRVARIVRFRSYDSNRLALHHLIRLVLSVQVVGLCCFGRWPDILLIPGLIGTS